MCAIDPIYAFEIKEDRVQWALGVIQEYAKEGMGKDLAFEVLFELGFGDAVDYESQGGLKLNLTDLQFVAFAAALRAVKEAGGRQVTREERGVLAT